eukprot:10994104-Alexandrium_andersonii.AAC.1
MARRRREERPRQNTRVGRRPDNVEQANGFASVELLGRGQSWCEQWPSILLAFACFVIAARCSLGR